jgi:hypothetical protein
MISFFLEEGGAAGLEGAPETMDLCRGGREFPEPFDVPRKDRLPRERR